MTDPTDEQRQEQPDGSSRRRSALADSVLYRRLHAHPVTAAVTKIVVTLLGGAVLAAGVIMLVTPGPAFVVIPAGLAILATEWPWARRLLVRARTAAETAKQRTLAARPDTRRRRLLAAAVAVGTVMAATGVALGFWLPGPLTD